jgi:REP element-mobilizing transposase RayT
MPARNSVKQFEVESFYHVYNRGAHKQPIYRDDFDKTYFLSLISRYLNKADNSADTNKHVYEKYYDIELLCYCLMDNHFHLLVYANKRPAEVSLFIKSVMTAYVMYFNKKYHHQGTIFQGVYKASKITNDSYLIHITRYIHLNPRYFKNYRFSSFKYYTQSKIPPVWLKPQRILGLFDGDYTVFAEDYVGHKAWLEEIYVTLADK